jgi:valyl-tRNA synthetase
LVKGFTVSDSITQKEESKIAIQWFESKFNEQLNIINDSYAKFRMSEALMTSYKLVWDDFCAWYLEMIKPEFVDGKASPIDRLTYNATIEFFEKIIKVLHPFMPFITEELWHMLKERDIKDCCIVSQWPTISNINEELISDVDTLIQIIAAVRNVRNQKNISPKEKLTLLEKSTTNINDTYAALLSKMSNLESVAVVPEKPAGATAFMVGKREFCVPLSDNIDVESEMKKLQEELSYHKGFLESVMKKLGNEKFVANAKPEIIANENKKREDAESKIKTIEEALGALK